MSDPIAHLRARFRDRTALDRERLSSLADGDLNGADLRRLIHGVAGAAGTFGFAALSQAAIQIDDLYASGAVPDRSDLARLDEAMKRVADGPV